MTNIPQGGSTANTHGRILENTLEPLFIQHGYKIFKYGDLKKREIKDEFDSLTKKVVKNAPYNSIYGHRGKTEFLLINKDLDKTVRIECKWQQSAGSVDEKFPYMLLNAIYAFEEEEIILLVDGSGYKRQARQWLEDKIASRWLLGESTKKIKLMTLAEFISYFNTNLR